MESQLTQVVAEQFRETSENLHLMTEDAALLAAVVEVAGACIEALRQGRKILFAGNGGSAADAQHLAAELVSRYAYDRPGLPGTDAGTLLIGVPSSSFRRNVRWDAYQTARVARIRVLRRSRCAIAGNRARPFLRRTRPSRAGS